MKNRYILFILLKLSCIVLPVYSMDSRNKSVENPKTPNNKYLIDYRVSNNTGKKRAEKDALKKSGKKGEEMQDAYYPQWQCGIKCPDGHHGFQLPIFVLADGHGHRGAKIAQTVVKNLPKFLLQSNKKVSGKSRKKQNLLNILSSLTKKQGRLKNLFCDSFTNLDNVIYRVLSKKIDEEELKRSGATVVALLLNDDRAHIAWAGDSVCYALLEEVETSKSTDNSEPIVFNNKRIKKLTCDHDLNNVDEVNRIGKDKIVEVDFCGRTQKRLAHSKTEITRSFGDWLGKEKDNIIVTPSYEQLPLVSSEDRYDEATGKVITSITSKVIAFVLLTDGVSNYIKPDEIEKIILKHRCGTAADSIVALATVNYFVRQLEPAKFLPDIKRRHEELSQLQNTIKDDIRKITPEQRTLLELCKNQAPDNQTVSVIKLNRENQETKLLNNAH